MERALMMVMAAGAVLGGADRIFGNKLGLGEQFVWPRCWRTRWAG